MFLQQIQANLDECLETPRLQDIIVHNSLSLASAFQNVFYFEQDVWLPWFLSQITTVALHVRNHQEQTSMLMAVSKRPWRTRHSHDATNSASWLMSVAASPDSSHATLLSITTFHIRTLALFNPTVFPVNMLKRGPLCGNELESTTEEHVFVLRMDLLDSAYSSVCW